MAVRSTIEMKEAVLNVLKANKGHVMSIEEVVKAVDIKSLSEQDNLENAFDELVDEGKIKRYIGLP